MDRTEENEIKKHLRSIGLPDDFAAVVLSGESKPSRDSMERIKNKTFARIGGRPVSATRIRRFGWLKAAAALLALALITAAWVGPAQVWAGLQKALGLAPGFGLFERDRSVVTLIASGRARVEYGGGYLEVSGILAQPEKTYINLYFNMIPGIIEMRDKESERNAGTADPFQRVRALISSSYLVDDAGREYHYQDDGFHAVSSNKDAFVSLVFPPLAADTGRITLTIPLPEGTVRVDIPLVSLTEIDEWGDVAGTVTRKGITVSAAALFGADALISLFIIPPPRIPVLKHLAVFLEDIFPPAGRLVSPVQISGATHCCATGRPAGSPIIGSCISRRRILLKIRLTSRSRCCCSGKKRKPVSPCPCPKREPASLTGLSNWVAFPWS